jgi:hypothetical protein
MLVEKNKYELGEVLSFKTVTGDEIVGTLVSIENGLNGKGLNGNDKRYTLHKPCIVITSAEGIGLIQAMFGLDPDLENLTLRDQHVIFICRTHTQMKIHYISVTTAE